MNRRPIHRRRLAAVGLLLALTTAPVLAADPWAEIAALLEGGLSEQTILVWLDEAAEALERPSAAQLLALKEAGASEELLQELLRRSRRPTESPRVETGSPSPAAPAAASPSAAGSRLPAPPSTPRAGRDAATAAAGSDVPVRFRLLYSPRFDEDEEEWDLLVYLDGHPLSYVPSRPELLGLRVGEPLELEIALPPGRHTLRLLQERHRQWRRGWKHAARVAERAFEFDLESDPPARVEVEFRQGWGALTDPLTFRFTQGDRVTDLVEVGGDPAVWPDLCEDSGEAAPGDECRGWGELWPAGAPSRAEVLETLARFEFRPVPR